MGKIPAQVEEMQGHIDSHMLAGYENRTTFFNEYVKPQLNNRDDREELTKENELRFRMEKQLAKMSEMFNGDPVAVHSVGIGLGESFQKAVESKWPFTFFTFDKNENMTKWVEDYKDLNQKRQEMEKTIGIDKLFEPKVPEMEVIQDKKLPGDNLIRQNEVKDPVL